MGKKANSKDLLSLYDEQTEKAGAFSNGEINAKSDDDDPCGGCCTCCQGFANCMADL